MKFTVTFQDTNITEKKAFSNTRNIVRIICSLVRSSKYFQNLFTPVSAQILLKRLDLSILQPLLLETEQKIYQIF